MSKTKIYILIILMFLSFGINWPNIFYGQQDDYDYYPKYQGLYQFEGYELETYEPFDMTYIAPHCKGKVRIPTKYGLKYLTKGKK